MAAMENLHTNETSSCHWARESELSVTLGLCHLGLGKDQALLQTNPLPKLLQVGPGSFCWTLQGSVILIQSGPFPRLDGQACKVAILAPTANDS